jgi:hypothetical protein
MEIYIYLEATILIKYFKIVNIYVGRFKNVKKKKKKKTTAFGQLYMLDGFSKLDNYIYKKENGIFFFFLIIRGNSVFMYLIIGLNVVHLE